MSRQIHTRIVLVMDLATDDRVDINGRLGAIARNVNRVDAGLTAEYIGYVSSQSIQEVPSDGRRAQPRSIDAEGFERF